MLCIPWWCTTQPLNHSAAHQAKGTCSECECVAKAVVLACFKHCLTGIRSILPSSYLSQPKLRILKSSAGAVKLLPVPQVGWSLQVNGKGSPGTAMQISSKDIEEGHTFMVQSEEIWAGATCQNSLQQQFPISSPLASLSPCPVTPSCSNFSLCNPSVYIRRS